MYNVRNIKINQPNQKLVIHCMHLPMWKRLLLLVVIVVSGADQEPSSTTNGAPPSEGIGTADMQLKICIHHHAYMPVECSRTLSIPTRTTTGSLTSLCRL